MGLIHQDLSTQTTIQCIRIIMALCWVIFTPLTIYHAYKFWQYKRRNIPFFKKRHPSLVLFSVILFNLYPLLFRPTGDFIVLYHLLPRFHAISVFTVNIIQIYPIVAALRLWLLYYDYNHALQSLSIKWKNQIKHKEDIPFLLRTKWIGDFKILSIIGISLGIFFLIVIIGGAAIFGESSLDYLQMTGMVFFFLIMFLAFKIRKCRDEFAIQREFILTGATMTIAMIGYVAVILILFELDTNWRIIAESILTCCCCYAFCLIPTYWINKQYIKQKVINDGYQNENNCIDADVTHLTLEQILSTKDGFDLYADHLVKEFSIENLFFVFEMVQIKHQVIKHRLLNKDDIGFFIPIAENRIDSNTKRKESHVYNIDELRDNFKYIYNEYIDIESIHCINISAMARRKIDDEYAMFMDEIKINGRSPTVDSAGSDIYMIKIDDIKTVNRQKQEQIYKQSDYIKQYITMYDRAMEEVVSLLSTDSLWRFQASKGYQAMIHDNN